MITSPVSPLSERPEEKPADLSIELCHFIDWLAEQAAKDYAVETGLISAKIH